MAQTEGETYTIGELAKCAGVTIRTIRYYCAEGLLPPPEVKGRYACYNEKHLSCLQFIAQLKNAYLPLSDIKARLANLTPEQIQNQLNGEKFSTPALMRESSRPQQNVPPVMQERESNLPAGLAHFVEETLALSSDLPSNQPPRRRRVLLISPMLSPNTGHFSESDEKGDIAGGYMFDEAVGETWKRVPLAPGVELHFRLPDTPEAREALDHVIAQTQAAFKLLR